MLNVQQRLFCQHFRFSRYPSGRFTALRPKSSLKIPTLPATIARTIPA